MNDNDDAFFFVGNKSFKEFHFQFFLLSFPCWLLIDLYSTRSVSQVKGGKTKKKGERVREEFRTNKKLIELSRKKKGARERMGSD